MRRGGKNRAEAVGRSREWANRWKKTKDRRKGWGTTDDIIERAFKKEMSDVLTRNSGSNWE